MPRHVCWDLNQDGPEILFVLQVTLIRNAAASAVAETMSDKAIPDEHTIAVGSSLLHSLPFELWRDCIDFGSSNQDILPTLRI
jgi:hypothetical protein